MARQWKGKKTTGGPPQQNEDMTPQSKPIHKTSKTQDIAILLEPAKPTPRTTRNAILQTPKPKHSPIPQIRPATTNNLQTTNRTLQPRRLIPQIPRKWQTILNHPCLLQPLKITAAHTQLVANTAPTPHIRPVQAASTINHEMRTTLASMQLVQLRRLATSRPRQTLS